MLSEMSRLLRRRRLWLLVVGVGSLFTTLLLRDSGGLDGQLPWWAVFRSHMSSFGIFLPMMTSVAVGTSLVEDRNGFLRFVLVRSTSRWQYVLAKYLGASAVLAGTVGSLVLWFGTLIRTVGPSSGTAYIDTDSLPPGYMEAGVGIVPVLAASMVLGAFLYLAVACLLAVLTRNIFVVVTTPFLVHLLGLLTVQGRWRVLNPLDNLLVELSRITPLWTFCYWLTMTSAVLVIALVTAARQESLA